ncbi:endonuclease Q family protein [Paenibacillus thermoaerophilus]|uniref:Endonuclease Q family protein n=1 Tax=Paenibacillus thermoaerophilus TaxID=1215385 RepID=A0ABW2V7C4_9BACL|nr:endonuclease Q family protein [Paenibacillus thermoaerophilus]TMV12007.1 TIGR00375 family protein [Paenibacillus thermoaerophilus]
MMRELTADLHIHIGRTEKGAPVKISGSRDLTFRNIAREASARKGIDMIGIIDCQSPDVLEEIADRLEAGEMRELPDGGIAYRDTVIVLGSEIEVCDPGFGAAHVLAYMPSLEEMASFSGWLASRMKNVRLSSQRVRVTARELQERVIAGGGLFVPAHIFTPHKGIYGHAAERMSMLLDLDGVSAVELGLSGDTELAGYLSELDAFPFLTNSDAHSLPNIAREYNVLRLKEASFRELGLALKEAEGRGIACNYGLHPALGKYHRSYCAACDKVWEAADAVHDRCPGCGGRIVRGVLDRVLSIADRDRPPAASMRPPYIRQVPLRFIPGVGPKLLEKLLAVFGTEMAVLHRASPDELASAVGDALAERIVLAREGRLSISPGGGGTFGKLL